MNQVDDPAGAHPTTIESAPDRSRTDLDRLREQFDNGVTLAVVEAIALCAKRREGAPMWVVDGLEKHRARLIAALGPPPQSVAPAGFLSEWLGRPEKIEEVEAGKGKSIVYGRESGEARRLIVKERDQTIVFAYQMTLRAGTPRHRAITQAHTDWKHSQPRDEWISRRQFSDIIDRDVKRLRRR